MCFTDADKEVALFLFYCWSKSHMEQLPDFTQIQAP